jgi:hypothetical protein
MCIVRGPRPTTNFYFLDKRISEDSRLSWAARGLLIYLLGKPDNWKVSVTHLVNETAEANTPAGRDAVYSLLKQLKEVGYIIMHRQALGDGKFGPVKYEVRELPRPDYPDAELGECVEDQPETDKPLPANPTQTNNDSNQEMRESKTDDVSSAMKTKMGKREKKPKPEPAEGFDAFWSAYPRKVGKDIALKAYGTALRGRPKTKTSPATPASSPEEIMTGLSLWTQIWEIRQTGLEFIPHASTWLNQRRFTDNLRGEIENARRGNNRQTSYTGSDRIESGFSALMAVADEIRERDSGAGLAGA